MVRPDSARDAWRAPVTDAGSSPSPLAGLSLRSALAVGPGWEHGVTAPVVGWRWVPDHDAEDGDDAARLIAFPTRGGIRDPVASVRDAAAGNPSVVVAVVENPVHQVLSGSDPGGDDDPPSLHSIDHALAEAGLQHVTRFGVFPACAESVAVIADPAPEESARLLAPSIGVRPVTAAGLAPSAATGAVQVLVAAADAHALATVVPSGLVGWWQPGPNRADFAGPDLAHRDGGRLRVHTAGEPTAGRLTRVAERRWTGRGLGDAVRRALHSGDTGGAGAALRAWAGQIPLGHAVHGPHVLATLDDWDLTDGAAAQGAGWAWSDPADAEVVTARALWRLAGDLVASGRPHPWAPSMTTDHLAVSLAHLAGLDHGEFVVQEAKSLEADARAELSGLPVARHRGEVAREGASSRVRGVLAPKILHPGGSHGLAGELDEALDRASAAEAALDALQRELTLRARLVDVVMGRLEAVHRAIEPEREELARLRRVPTPSISRLLVARARRRRAP